ncbi:MAG: hypothetical protein IID18_04680, partial [Nitrospinae bacterium]|nr:hypothetical protein [Nitrospinota bacterium]
MDEKLKSDGMDVSSYIDLFPQSTIMIDPSITVRNFGPPAEYELKELLTGKGMFTSQYKEAIQKLYDDPDLNLKSITSVKGR